ncbi:hypothetical protein F3S47_05795 [Histidinibacterium aquaticum]|uniref:TNase-like domain-containing protein n=1 Tax=Histidinibacterium aquaticum TaxID=2613962 RepID=A0A5J5GMD2_9RHOB|nr:hypothetical protein F3S47_05795 [Histidinibacterium aquaticum]
MNLRQSTDAKAVGRRAYGTRPRRLRFSLRQAKVVAILAILVLGALGALNLDSGSDQEVTRITLDNSVQGSVTHIRDGDTIEVAGTPIRFEKLDCDETGTPYGRMATQLMRELVQGQQLSCTLTGRRSYDRMIGSCRLPDGRDLGEIMISEGVCDRYR